jgi:HAD superfamily hydrolase (TIGR01459 family)
VALAPHGRLGYQGKMTKSTSPSIPILPSIAPLAGRYDAWLSDIWGVIHNGARAFEAACDACTRFRAQGGVVVLISNAPRPWDAVAVQLDKFGVPRSAYDAIITSGDVTRALLAKATGKSVFHMGPDRDRGVFQAGVRFAPVESAELVVNTGLFDDLNETPADYDTILRGLQARGIAMICANPDLMVEKGDKLLYCAGALAQSYEAMGGKVMYAGKPHLPVYDEAFALVAKALAEGKTGRTFDKRRVLAIGDGLRTDMAGAQAAGLDAIFIPSLLHADGHDLADSAGITALFEDTAFRPIGAQLGLRW